MFKNIYKVLIREIELISKDFSLMVIIFLAPLFYVFFYCSIYVQKTEQNLPIAVVDSDNSSMSRYLTRCLDIHQLLEVKFNGENFAKAREQLYRGEILGIVYIERDFQKNLKKGSGGNLKIFLNTATFLPSNDLNKAVNEVVATMNAGISLKYFETKGYNFGQAKKLILPVSADIRPLFNTTESYGDFFMPILLCLILQQTLLIGLSQTIAKEREENSLDNLFRRAGSSIWTMLNGKILFYFVLFSAYAFFFFNIPLSVFKINFLGSGGTLTLLTAVFFTAVISYGVFISSFFTKKLYAFQFFIFTSFPFILLSGCSWPLASMPLPLQYLAKIIPSTPYIAAFIRVTQMGVSLDQVSAELLHLLLLAVAGITAAFLRMRVLVKKSQNSQITA